MKRITRTIGVSAGGNRVWLDASGHWTHDESKAHAFPDDEAEQRVRRIPHAEKTTPTRRSNDV